MKSKPRVPSTREIVARRALNRSVDEGCVEWAVSMLVAGYDTPHLAMLAGEMPPFNQFAMIPLLEKVLRELGEDWSDVEVAVKGYAVELLEAMLAGQVPYVRALRELQNICVELDYAPYLYDFYLPYFALYDLREYGVQYYWDGATRENIDEIVRAHARQWIARAKG